MVLGLLPSQEIGLILEGRVHTGLWLLGTLWLLGLFRVPSKGP